MSCTCEPPWHRSALCPVHGEQLIADVKRQVAAGRIVSYDVLMHRLSHCSDCGCEFEHPHDDCTCVCHESEAE